jgi:hypothetical protein
VAKKQKKSYYQYAIQQGNKHAVVILDAEEKHSLGSDIFLNVKGRDNSVIIGGKWKVAAEYKRFLITIEMDE